MLEILTFFCALAWDYYKDNLSSWWYAESKNTYLFVLQL